MTDTEPITGPGRRPTDPSGTKVPVKINLSPRHRKILDELATKRGLSRSVVVERLLERTTPKGNPVEEAAKRRGQ